MQSSGKLNWPKRIDKWPMPSKARLSMVLILNTDSQQKYVRQSPVIAILTRETNMKRSILASLAGLSLMALAASAAELEYPKQVIDATYEISGGKMGTQKTRMMSDGKGHMRVESGANG